MQSQISLYIRRELSAVSQQHPTQMNGACSALVMVFLSNIKMLPLEQNGASVQAMQRASFLSIRALPENRFQSMLAARWLIKITPLWKCVSFCVHFSVHECRVQREIQIKERSHYNGQIVKQQDCSFRFNSWFLDKNSYKTAFKNKIKVVMKRVKLEGNKIRLFYYE